MTIKQMPKEELNLSDKIYTENKYVTCVNVEEVKEFVQMLNKYCNNRIDELYDINKPDETHTIISEVQAFKELVKHYAGDKLI